MYNRVGEVTVPFAKISMTSLFFLISKLFCFFNFSSNHIMFSQLKIFRREHFSETIAIILILKSLSKSYVDIVVHTHFFKFTVSTIVHRLQRQKIEILKFTKRVDRFVKLDARIKRRLIRHVKTNSHDNFAILVIFFKTDKFFHRDTVRRYLKTVDFFRFKIKKKPFLTSKHKLVRLK